MSLGAIIRAVLLAAIVFAACYWWFILRGEKKLPADPLGGVEILSTTSPSGEVASSTEPKAVN